MNKNNSLHWINGVKLISIIAVIVTHTHTILYSNLYINRSSSFSVTLFVLISGVGTAISFTRKGQIISFKENLLKLLPLLKSYAFATFVLVIFENRINDYYYALVTFSASGVLYFMFFFLQLKIITPYLLNVLHYCDKQKYKYLFHTGTLLIVLILSSIFINYTHLLPLYGGGKHLLGGTYFFVYYLGLVLGSLNIFNVTTIKKVFIFVLSFGLFVVWSYKLYLDALPFDAWLSPFFRRGDNPPSFNYIILAISVLFVCYSFFSILSSINIKPVHLVLKITDYLGNGTLYVFFYHLAILAIITSNVPISTPYPIWFRFVLFVSMLCIPPLIASLYYRLKHSIKAKKDVESS